MKKTVLITGATGGIGLAFTKLLAKKGYRLLLVSSSEKRLQHLKELLLRVAQFSSGDIRRGSCGAGSGRTTV